jgi:hypothetical protein
MSVLAYANPGDIQDERQRADGYGVARFQVAKQAVTFECWPRFSDARKGDGEQFPGWPQTFRLQDNDGRKPTGYLPTIDLGAEGERAVVQVIQEQTGETIYVSTRVCGRYVCGQGRCRPPRSSHALRPATR